MLFAHIQSSVESTAIILTDDVDSFQNTVQVTSFTCFDREKGLENRGKSQDYLVSRPAVSF